jgi:hypothetical protein
VQRPSAFAATLEPGRRRELFIDAGEEMKKRGILQYAVAHFGGLLSW